MPGKRSRGRGRSPQKARSRVRRRNCDASRAADGAERASRPASARGAAPGHSADGRTQSDQRPSPRIARPAASRTIPGNDPGRRKRPSSCRTVAGESSSVYPGLRDLAGRRDGIVRRTGDLYPGVDIAGSRDRHEWARATCAAPQHRRQRAPVRVDGGIIRAYS
jgi:hypothetical protein